MNKKDLKNLTDPFWDTNSNDKVTGHKQTITVFNNNISLKLRSYINGFIGLCFVMVLLFQLSGCKQQTKANGPEYGNSPALQTKPIYHFVVHPLHNPAMLMRSYQPLMDYLNKKIKGAEFILEASRDYAGFEEKYKNRSPEFLLPNPWQTLQAIKSGYTVITMAGEPEDFKGIFIVRKDGGISEPADLIGKAVSYPSPTALAACIMPQYFLYFHGININKDITNIYVGSQESSIMNVFLKKTAVGATWPPPWRSFQKTQPIEAAQLKVLWETEPLINNSVMVRNDVSSNIRNQVQKLLTDLNKSEEGKKILKNMETARFIKATNKDYDVMQTYMDRFEKKVRKIDIK